jgi:DNA topoisomerase-1
MGSSSAVPVSIPPVPDEKQSARKAGLHYAIPKGKGIQRRRAGNGFVYLDEEGKLIRDKETLDRIRSLVIPPAYSSVWISPDPYGHIQAVGWDARGRKQYRYHPEYRKVRDLVKFDRMQAFGKVLPKIRRAVDRDLKVQGMPKRKVLAAVVKLLDTTYIRIGNEEYAEDNGSFGLTTFRNRHVEILGEMLKFKFRGKSGQNHEIKLRDARLARILHNCKCIPGSALFLYIDEQGQPASIESGDVNEYLREISGGDFTAKDFRTWGGTCLAAGYLLQKGAWETAKQLKSTLVDVVKDVSSKLGNKPATCRKYYIHPAVLDTYSAGTLCEMAQAYRDSRNAYIHERIVLSLIAPLKRARRRAA